MTQEVKKKLTTISIRIDREMWDKASQNGYDIPEWIRNLIEKLANSPIEGKPSFIKIKPSKD